jgi:hypothetical protein
MAQSLSVRSAETEIPRPQRDSQPPCALRPYFFGCGTLGTLLYRERRIPTPGQRPQTPAESKAFEGLAAPASLPGSFIVELR